MDYNLEAMTDWERKKAIFILNEAETLGIDTSAYGMLAVNDSSGYTYLWIEDYNFTLYMPINCELRKNEIQALWSSPEDGEEITKELTTNTTLAELESWAQEKSELTEEA